MTNALRKTVCQTCLAFILAALPPEPGIAQEKPATTAQPQKDTSDGFDYSFDRLSFELTKSLGDRPAFVIWLFDESGSVTERRRKVIERLQQIYGSGKRPHSLFSAAVGFGKETHLLTANPVDDIPSLKTATEQFRRENSGEERVFTTVVTVLDHWKTFIDEKQPLDVSLVIVTDERGDGQESLEDAVNSCRERNVRVFCLGDASRFGKEKGLVRFTYPDGFSEMIPVDSGPETAFADVLDFEIWPHPSADELKRLSSGFGPWALERLCAESGGRYFIVEDTAMQHFARAAMLELPQFLWALG